MPAIDEGLARLALANGTVLRGRSFGARRTVVGELVFNTAMTGYQEVVTDPSYRGQIVLMTAPQIGNVGWNRGDLESTTAHAAGFVVRELSPTVSNWRSEVGLHEALLAAGVPGISGVDTRTLTRLLREEGSLGAVLSPVPVSDCSDEELVAAARRWGGMEGRDLVSEVTCPAPYTWEESSLRMPGEPAAASFGPPGALGHAVVYDFGVKHAILRQLCDVGFRVTVVPARTPPDEVLACRPDGVVLSNGPGDPAALPWAVQSTQVLLAKGVPLLGICLGHQILSLALGGRTYKLKFGHHGINHPVKDLRTGRVEITSQNHGFSVDFASLHGVAVLTHLNLNDNTVEGLALPGRPVLSLQYHPEASPGPRDAGHLFCRFARLVRGEALDGEGG
ncbi:MAG: glutamine-hydrolyzing carbamoyl-phosphate synthase small subunit [Myxococcales bacterium]|nr:glutamine-hydrolyzing carbamoyl-phosphate synthase small subunit [Myxococcota bacterium]MDW8280476.1 glutamine-hydrolyzing carbamoyl-phosphate synthase small subunit [Myxococcales bacterium]